MCSNKCNHGSRMQYLIMMKYPELGEQSIDAYDNYEEANKVLNDYRRAFGNGVSVWIHSEKKGLSL